MANAGADKGEATDFGKNVMGGDDLVKELGDLASNEAQNEGAENVNPETLSEEE